MPIRLVLHPMRIGLLIRLVALGLAAAPTIRLRGEDLETLQGKWMVQKTNDQGRAFQQLLEFKRDKFTFAIKGVDGASYLYAAGDVKLAMAGPFKTLSFVNIRAGSSESELNPVDDDRQTVYALGIDTLTAASNFDKDRDQPPTLDVYKRMKSEAASMLIIEDVLMERTPQSATWFLCFEVTAGPVTQKYHIEDKGYDKTPVTIPLNLTLSGVAKGQKCTFTLKLDDVDGDACGDDADNRSSGDFLAGDKGSQSYKPEEQWRYTVHWRME